MTDRLGIWDGGLWDILGGWGWMGSAQLSSQCTWIIKGERCSKLIDKYVDSIAFWFAIADDGNRVLGE